MHEVSLNQVIRDYLSGDQIDLTTYEDIRQAIARFLVEDKNYPSQNIMPRYKLELDIGKDKYSVQIDFVIYYMDRPVLILAFCPGAVSTYITQYTCLARIFPDSPVPFVVITDSKDAALIDVRNKKEICRGFHCIPRWNDLMEMADKADSFTISKERVEKDKRVAYAMFALSDMCCSSECVTG